MIKGFWHIYLVNNWEAIFREQLQILVKSGLYKECHEINIGCIGASRYRLGLQHLIAKYPKIKIKAFSRNAKEYEFTTLRLIEADNTKYIGFYFHLKGVSRPKDGMQKKERRYLNETMLNQWRTPYRLLMDGYDIVSPNYMTIPRRFTGNFFWFHRSLINKLPRLKNMDLSDRYVAEYWIHMACSENLGMLNKYTRQYT